MTDFTSLIAKRTFKLSNQLEFANISGDFNPIHVDADAAKKTISGECIVHGMNALLWTLDALLQKYDISISEIKVDFQNPIKLEQEVSLHLYADANKMELISQENEKLLTVKYVVDKVNDIGGSSLGQLKKLPSAYFAEFSNFEINQEILSIYGGDEAKVAETFPFLSKAIGIHRVYEISLLSNIVGMQMPGLHSMFISCGISLNDGSKLEAPKYQIIEKHDRFKMLKIWYQGKNITSEIVALERPYYTPKTCDEIKKISFDLGSELKEKKILVIGGSRGIGAVFAKLASLMGAQVAITYSSSETDARDVCKDIEKHTNSNPHFQQLDVTNFEQLKDIKLNYDILCYFASPKIFNQSSNHFNDALFSNFYEVYCESFKIIFEKFVQSKGQIAYYPSTIALEQDVKGIAEYKLAKEMGEKLCSSLSKKHNCKIIVDRLERTETDQTTNVLRTPSLNPVDVAVAIAKKIIEEVI